MTAHENEKRPGACRQGRNAKAHSIIADAPARAFDMPDHPRPTVADLARRDAVLCGTLAGTPLLLALLWMAGL